MGGMLHAVPAAVVVCWRVAWGGRWVAAKRDLRLRRYVHNRRLGISARPGQPVLSLHCPDGAPIFHARLGRLL